MTKPIQLHPLFGSGAILQRGEPIPIWGSAEPQRRIHLNLGPKRAACQSNDSGNFLVWIPPMDTGGPHSLCAAYDCEESLELSRDLLIGEVWIASGQSNMAWALEKCGAEGAAAIASSRDDSLRIFRVNNPPELNRAYSVDGSWQSACPAAAAAFPATAFHFAKFLRHHLKVPVGMVVAAWGGTFIQAWMSRSALFALSKRIGWTRALEVASHTPSRWTRMSEAGENGQVNNLPADPGNEGFDQGWASPHQDTSKWPTMPLPGRWQQHGHDYSGVFWFRRTVELPSDWLSRDLELLVGAFDKQDICYANGVQIGRTGTGFDASFWNVSRRYSIPSSLTEGGTLTLAFRVYSFSGEGRVAGPLILKNASSDRHLDIAGEWAFQVEHNFGKVEFAHMPGHGCPNTPHILYDSLIHPIVPCAARGVIWYQGEQNLGDADDYDDLLGALIRDWRYQWGNPDWPFIVAQLPRMNPVSDFDPYSKWAQIRESQRKVVAATPWTGLAVTLDLGDECDIHPKQKREVGRRLANAALRTAYDSPVGGSGPVPSGCHFRNDSVVVTFAMAGHGLRTSDGKAPSGVFLMDSHGTFRRAHVSLEGDRLVARSESVLIPSGIRYAWADNPLEANICDGDGIPASPFQFLNLRKVDQS